MTRTPRARVETLLLDFARRLAKQPQGWVAVVVALTQLQPCFQRAYHRAVAVDGFRKLERKEFGSCFELASGDLVFVGRQTHALQIQTWMQSLAHLFRADPLQTEAEEEGQGRLCQWYDLAADYVMFLAYCEGLAAREGTREPAAPPPALRALDAEALGILTEALPGLDLRHDLRRRPVCLVAGGAAQVVFEELTCPLPDVMRRVIPDLDPAMECNLAQYLAEALDQRFLEALVEGGKAPFRRIGLALSLAALDSPAFRHFDRALPARAQSSIVIALRPTEVFADLAGFARRAARLREREYRVALAPVSLRAALFLDRERLGVDMLKLAWQDGQERVLDTAQRQALREALARAGAARVVLTGADSASALEFGREVGVHLFQGAAAEALIAQPARARA